MQAFVDDTLAIVSEKLSLRMICHDLPNSRLTRRLRANVAGTSNFQSEAIFTPFIAIIPASNNSLMSLAYLPTQI